MAVIYLPFEAINNFFYQTTTQACCHYITVIGNQNLWWSCDESLDDSAKLWCHNRFEYYLLIGGRHTDYTVLKITIKLLQQAYVSVATVTWIHNWQKWHKTLFLTNLKSANFASAHSWCITCPNSWKYVSTWQWYQLLPFTSKSIVTNALCISIKPCFLQNQLLYQLPSEV